MKDFIYSAKKFYATYRALIVIVIAISLGFMNFKAYDFLRTEYQKQAVIYVPSTNIPPRTLIQDEHLKQIEVPLISLDTLTYVYAKEDIVGTYTNLQTTLYKGATIHKSAIIKKENITDSYLDELGENEVAFPIKVDLQTTLGNTILPEAMVDIYFKGVARLEDQDKVIHGLIAEKVRVIKTINSDGIETPTSTDNKQTVLILVALSEENLDYIQKSSELGEIVALPSWKSYTPTEVSHYYDINLLKSFIGNYSYSFIKYESTVEEVKND